MNTNQQTTVVKGSIHKHTNRRAAITAQNLIRCAGLAAIAAGIIFIAMQLIHPEDILSLVGNDRWEIVHVLGVTMCFLGLLGITGIYARQVEESGWLGLAGYFLLSLFYAITLAFQFVEAFISPVLATKAPELEKSILKVVGGSSGQMDFAALVTIYMVTGILYLLGGLLFGIATFRARILSRWAGGLLAVGTILPLFLSSFVHHPYDRIFAVPVGLSLAWLGYSLWSERREKA